MCVHMLARETEGWTPRAGLHCLAGQYIVVPLDSFQQGLEPIGRPLVDGDLQVRRWGLVEL